jgi:hypothetical protein
VIGRRRDVAGIIALALVLAQIATGMVLPLGNVHIGSADPHDIPHVTSPEGDDCPPPHNELACQICRTLRGPSELSPTSIYLARPATTPVRESAMALDIAHSSGTCSPIGPRAPPIA